VSHDGWKAFRLVPSDVLFFRDSKPSMLGQDHYLRSIFPPFPSTLYGAVRTRRLFDHGVELAGLGEATWRDRLGDALVEELGAWGGFGSLELRGPWLVRGQDEPLLSVPADLGVNLKRGLRSRDERPEIAEVVRFQRGDAGERRQSHSLEPLYPFTADGKPWKAPGPGVEPRSAAGEWFLTPNGLSAWRKGGVPEAGDLVHRTELWCDEARTGVGLQAARRASEEGRLYTFGYVRLLDDVAIGFEVKGSGLQPGGFVRLGGEARTAALEEGPAFPSWNGEVPTEARLSLCFAAPALSAAGGYPPGFAADRLESVLGDQRCRLTGAALPRFVLSGGWDVARKFPKTLRRAIPAGSVFLFESVTGQQVSPADFDGRCYSDFPGDALARQGFGLAVAGLSP
jgi:CRISPR-associated protein Cmr3